MFNIARIPLSPVEKELLNKGLIFCPNPGTCNTSENEEAINDLIRKIHINAFQLTKKGAETTTGSTNPDIKFIKLYKKKSNWSPFRHRFPQKL